jgi:hypothetical protein
MSVQVDWARIPINIKSTNKSKLVELLNYLKEKGLKKHSIIMPNRESGGYLFFIYDNINKKDLDKWITEGE